MTAAQVAQVQAQAARIEQMKAETERAAQLITLLEKYWSNLC